jgi:hypothetical protein
LSDKSGNILIGYTKWLLKWAAIISVAIGGVIAGVIGYEEYQDQLIPMMAIECEVDDKEGPHIGGVEGKRHYLIQRKRKSPFPHALYRPAYYNDFGDLGRETRPNEYWKQYTLKDHGLLETRDQLVYRFESDNSLRRHDVTRDTLEVIWSYRKDKKNKWEKMNLSPCREITIEEFDAESKRGWERIKTKVKF